MDRQAGRRFRSASAENLKPGATDWQLTRVRPDRDGFRISLDRRLLLEAEREGRRDASTSWSRPTRRGGSGSRSFGWATTAAVGLGPDEDARPVRRQGPAAPGPGTTRIFMSAGGHRRSVSTIPADWPSGVYLGRLTTLVDAPSEPYWQSYVVFIVRDDRPADILFQCSDNTWQAYNRWPNHYSLYTHPAGKPGALGRRQLRSALRPRGAIRRRRQRPAHVRLGRVPAVRVPAGLLAGATRLRRDLSARTATCSRRTTASLQGIHQRRPRRILGHPPVPQRPCGCATRA